MDWQVRRAAWWLVTGWLLLSSLTVPAQQVPPRVAAGEELLRVGETIALALAAENRLPSQVEVKLTDGTAVKVAAADALYLLCQLLAEWQSANALPVSVPLPTRAIQPSEVASAPLPGDSRILASTDLISPCRSVAELMRQLGRMPAGVWVGEVRLSPAEFTGALATLVQYYRYYQTFPPRVGVRPYLPPQEWQVAPTAPATSPAAGTSPVAASTPPAGTRPRWPGPLPPASARLDSPQGEEAAPSAPPQPKLLLVPAKGSKLSGMAELALYYQGPPAFLRLTVRGRLVGISNRSPLVYRWDTRLEPDGAVKVQAEAIDASGKSLVRVEQHYRLSNGNQLGGSPPS